MFSSNLLYFVIEELKKISVMVNVNDCLSHVYKCIEGVNLEVVWISNNKHHQCKIYKLGTVSMYNF